MKFSRFSGAALPKVVRASATSVFDRLGRTAWAALPALAILTILPVSSKAATLLQSGSTLVFTGNATVTALSLTWSCNEPLDTSCAAGTGDFSVGSSTGTFAPYNSTFGRVMDIGEANQPIQDTPFTPLDDFITFVANGNITLNLDELPEGTDTPSATCGTDATPVMHCTPTNAVYVSVNNPLGLSPFNLDYDPITNETTASFAFLGTVDDNVVGDSPASGSYVGGFSEPLQGYTPADVVAALANPGFITSGYGENGTLTITLTPEPMTLSLMGLGLLGIGLIGRRKQKVTRP